MANTDPATPAVQYEWQRPNLKTFDFGRVFGRAFTGVFSNFKPLAMAGAIGLVVSILLSLLTAQTLSDVATGNPVSVSGSNGVTVFWILTIFGLIFSTFITLWIQLIVVQISYAEFTNSPRPSSPLTSALRFVLPMFVIAVVYTIACYLGLLFLFIGFFFVWPGWALAGPILVHEERGIFGSLGEAWILSAGSKRWLFLLMFLLGVILFIGIFVMLFVFGIGLAFTDMSNFSGNTLGTLGMSTGQQVAYNAVSAFFGYFIYALFASALTAAYVEIKTMKGEVGSIGEVFA